MYQVWTGQSFVFSLSHWLCFCLSSVFCNYPHGFLYMGFFLLLPVILPLCLSLFIRLSIHVSITLLCGSLFCFGHRYCLQRFEGFRNDKTMPPSLEPSCSGATEDGPVTANHLRSVPHTHLDIFIYFYSASQSISTLWWLNIKPCCFHMKTAFSDLASLV